jgi:arabinan endo-1,5-alpha-L-arabinosidase
MKFTRRQLLKSSCLVGFGLMLPSLNRAQSDDELTGNYRPVHDPCIIKEGDTYYLYCTGPLTPIRSSTDLIHWELLGDVFTQIPEWAVEAIPGTEAIWAPDISHYNDKYHLYYSVSTFGSNRSVIGLATNTTLDPSNSDYQWIDEGLVIESQRSGDYNAIDPNLIMDDEGTPWLAFGSFWSGIKMRRLDIETGKPSAEDDALYSLSSRSLHPRAVEAPFIIRKDQYYYLFVSFDACCRGAASTYRVMVGRSDNVTGPYVDRDGVPMLEDGGTQVTFPTSRWRGPGHNAILQNDGVEKIVYHAYDATYGGLPTLHIDTLEWDDEGWPVVPQPESDTSND